MIKIHGTTERIESKGGLLLTGKIAAKAGLGNIYSTFVKNAGAVITCLFGILTEGSCTFESIGKKRGSLFFKEAFDLPFVYAKETIRIYLDKMAAEAEIIIRQLRETSIKIIRKAPLHGIWVNNKKYMPVDIDTSPMDNSKTKKEGVSCTYKGYEGFHPIFAYIGREGYMLNCELRPGNQHCQKGTVDFIREIKKDIGSIPGVGRILYRMDSGNDSFEALKAITGGKCEYCIVKRNKRKENDEIWLKRAKRHGTRIQTRKGKKVWIGIIKLHPEKDGEKLRNINCVFEVTERTIDSRGNYLVIPEVEVNNWWTNLKCDAEEVIKLYHAHATSEQFHSELKNDMDVERLPSGKLAVNKIVLATAMNAFNALRLIGQESLKKENCNKFTKRKRISKVIRDLIDVAGKLIKHGRELIFKIYEKDPALPVFLRLNILLDSL